MMILLSKLCGLMIFVYCVCRLSAREYGYRDLSLWAHLFLVPSAVAIVISPTLPTIESLVFRVGVALYFASQTWRIWRLQQKMKPTSGSFSGCLNFLKKGKKT